MINAASAAKTAASSESRIQLKNTFWHYLMRQHLLPTKAGQNHCITANWGKNRIKSLRNGNKSNNPFASPHFLLVLPRFFAFFLFLFFLFSGRVLLCYPKRIFHLAGSFAGSSLLRRALFASVFRAGQSRIWPKPSPGPSWPKLAQTGR